MDSRLVRKKVAVQLVVQLQVGALLMAYAEEEKALMASLISVSLVFWMVLRKRKEEEEGVAWVAMERRKTNSL